MDTSSKTALGADDPDEVLRLAAPAAIPPSAHATLTLESPELYFNRELSLLEFQKRVLEQAQDSQNPLLERVKFLSIVSSNLDEFFMVRVAGLQQQLASGTPELSVDALAPAAQLQLIREEVRMLIDDMQDLLSDTLLPALQSEGIRVSDMASLTPEQRVDIDSYFLETVFPVLTPLAFDPRRPFPHISSGVLNLAVVVRDGLGTENFARIRMPNSLPRLVPVVHRPDHGKNIKLPKAERTFVWLERLVAVNLSQLFPGFEIVEAHPFRITRDAEVAIQELESDDLLESVEDAIQKRRFSSVVRVQVGRDASDGIVEILTTHLAIHQQDVYRIRGPIGLAQLMELYTLDRPDLKYKPYVPSIPANLAAQAEQNIFSVIRREDIVLHHPYESFEPIVEFLEAAARDPDVLAIKMTLYRVGHKSPIVAALLEAVERGKEVAVLVELKARFDEESNIEWARTLEDAGVHLVYGLVDLKVHSKIALVVRREGEVIRRYLHLGTGNYNSVTARQYTDFGFLTCNPQIADDATPFFNALTGYSTGNAPHELLVAPVNLRPRLEELIRREIALQEKGEHGRLIFKMNALEDPQMIRLLYRASQAGVKVDLLVRGLCCLRPSIEGFSENIRVTSIVGRFLEHSRAYYFRNGGSEEIYLGSADLMRRNLSHRVEILFPIHNPDLVSRLKNILHIQLSDDRNSYHMRSDGHYARSKKREQPGAIDSQLQFLQEPATRQVSKTLGAISRKRRVAGRRAHARPES